MNIIKEFKEDTVCVTLESPIRTLIIDNIKNGPDLDKTIAVLVWYVNELDKYDFANDL